MSERSTGEPLNRASGSPRLSRRRFLQVSAGAAGAAAVGAGAFEAVRTVGGGGRPSLSSMPVRPTGPVRAFHSRPDLRPPAVALTSPQNLDNGYLFIGPWPYGLNQPGPLMIDHQAEPVWFRPVSASGSAALLATNFRSHIYRGEPVLAWWEGRELHGLGLGQGEAVIVDRSYREVARVRAAGGRMMDLHEFLLTPQGTALFTCYPETVPADLRSIGGPRRGTVLNSILQEVDVRTGRLLFEWQSLNHIPVDECHPDGDYHDLNYMHLNSIGLTPDGNLLVSGRHTWTLYKLDRHTGQVIWRLGGKRNDFTIDPDAQFRWQHHARQPSTGTISVFDNGALRPTPGHLSRGLVLNVDEVMRRVSLAQAFRHSPPLFANSQGSVQILPSGNVLVGWGSDPDLSEFTPAGKLLSDGHLLSGFQSYRVWLLPWRGTPERPPDLAGEPGAKAGNVVLYASWNGDTETTHWQVHAGDSQRGLHPIGIARRRAFETAIPLGDVGRYVAVTALSAAGRPLGQSSAIRL